MTKIIVTKEFEKERLDKFLLHSIAEHTRSYIKNLIESGNVNVNGKKIEKAGFLLKNGDFIDTGITPDINALTTIMVIVMLFGMIVMNILQRIHNKKEVRILEESNRRIQAARLAAEEY